MTCHLCPEPTHATVNIDGREYQLCGVHFDKHYYGKEPLPVIPREPDRHTAELFPSISGKTITQGSADAKHSGGQTNTAR